MGACTRATVTSFSLCETNTTEATEFASGMALKEVYVCEMQISETERCPALYDCLLKEYSNMGLKERLWGKVCKALCF